MARPFTITIQTPDDGDVNVSGELTDEESAQLDAYMDEHDALCRSRPLREGFPSKVVFKWDKDSGASTEVSIPDDDTLSILLHRLRPFLLTKEPASFDRIVGTLKRRLDHEYLRRFLDEQRELYDGRDFQGRIRITTHQGPFNCEAMVQKWLNSHDYHRDADKRVEVANLFDWLPGELGKGILVLMLVDKVNAIRNVAALAAVVTGRTTKLRFQLFGQVA